MPTTILLIRHGMTDSVGVRLTSRAPGVTLSLAGRTQVEQLRTRLREAALAAVYSSPMERTLATAEPIARDRGLPVQTLDELIEVDFGEWTGLTFAELDEREDWQRFNATRGSAPVPGGETAPQVQARIVGALETLARRHAGETIAAVSHGDVIRNAVLHAAGTPIDLWHRFEISPASITAVAIDGSAFRLLTVNERPYAVPGS
jgi:probable phosphoglycerate mutase